jgi:hypothetical protein
MSRALVGAQLVTPGDWNTLDLDPRSRRASVRAAVRQAVTADPTLAPHGVRLVAILDDAARRAHAAGAFFCSSLVAAAEAGLLVANAVLQLSPVTACVQWPASASQACAGLAAAVLADADHPDVDVDVVVLPLAGPAVRTMAVSGGVCVQYLVPVPDAARHVVLTLTSPCPPYVSAALELFDAIAGSLALEYAD